MLTREYDDVFKKYADDIPIALLRALAYPFSVKGLASDGSAGLFNIQQATLANYNQTHGTNYGTADLMDPDTNTKIGVWVLQKVANALIQAHGKTVSRDWKDLRNVGLIIQGYHCGYGESTGNGKVIGGMEAKGFTPDRITFKTVAQAAPMLGGNDFLAQSARTSYIQSVLDRYASESSIADAPVASAEPSAPALPPISSAPSDTGDTGGSPFAVPQKIAVGITKKKGGIWGLLLLCSVPFVFIFASKNKKKKSISAGPDIDAKLWKKLSR